LDYEGLLDEAFNLGLIVKEAKFKGNYGRIKGNRIAIRKDIPTLKEKAFILAEELGHYFTSYGDILNQEVPANRKQEYKARLWSYNKQIGLIGIISAFNAGCRSLFDMAEYLDVPEGLLSEALKCYKDKYGESIKIDNYIIFFEPNLGVMRLI
jgi:hypothetical protein